MLRCMELLTQGKLVRNIILTVVLIGLVVSVCFTYLNATTKRVRIVDGTAAKVVETRANTIGALLMERKIVLAADDAIQPNTKDNIAEDMEVTIFRAQNITVKDDAGDEVAYRTNKPTVQEFFAEVGIKVSESDVVHPPLDSLLFEGASISIKRAILVEIHIGGETKDIYTSASDVGGLLKTQEIVLGEHDLVSAELSEALFGGMEIAVTRIEKRTETIDETIPFDRSTKQNGQMPRGETRIITEGQNGVERRTYEIVLEDGTETARTLLSSEVITAKRDQVTEVGTMTTTLSSRGESLRYSRVLTCTATAYDLSYASCGKNPGDKGYGITASGRKAGVGVIAVDPSVIPLGTRLYVESSDGGKSWVYGECIAGDTGGSIKGNKIDLFFNTSAEVRSFGRRTATVYILD